MESHPIKLLSKWTFACSGTIDWRGIWEVAGVEGLDKPQPIYTLRRVLTHAMDAPVGETMKVPAFLILEHGTKVTIISKPPPHGV